MALVRDLKAKMQELSDQIEEIQNACTHPKPALTETFEKDVGNQDARDDGTYVTSTCGLCEKVWVKFCRG